MDNLVDNSLRAGLPGLVGAPAALVKAAAGWWTVAYRVEVRRQRLVEDDEGRHMEMVEEANTVVRGWRGEQMFVAAWKQDGKAECAYWWQREHEAWAELPRELVRWTTPTPTPVRVSFPELKRKLRYS